MKRLVVTLWILLGSTTSVAQELLHGMDVQGNLFTVDLTTGAGTAIGVLEFSGSATLAGYNEIVHNPISNRSYAQERDGNFRLQPFNHITAAASGAAVDDDGSWHALEFVGDTLYGVYFTQPGESNFATLNPNTGLPSDIASFTLGVGVNVTGLAWNGAVLFAITNGGSAQQGSAASSVLYEIDRLSGVTTEIGSTGMRAGGMSVGPDGQLYAGGSGSNRGQIWRIYTTTGAGTLLGASGFGQGQGNGIGGLMTADRSAPPPLPPRPRPTVDVPTLMTGAPGLIAALLLIGLLQLRRR